MNTKKYRVFPKFKEGLIPGSPRRIYAVYRGKSADAGIYLGLVPAYSPAEAVREADKHFTIKIGEDITVVSVGTEVFSRPITKQ